MKVIKIELVIEISGYLVDEDLATLGRMVEKMIENNSGDGMYVRDYEVSDVDDGEEADTGDAGE
jgi:hypothetical protein